MFIFQGVVTFWSDAEIQGNYDWTEQLHTGVRIQVIDVMPRKLIELTVHVYMMLAFDRKEAKLIKLNHTRVQRTGLDTPFPQATLARNSRLYYHIW